MGLITINSLTTEPESSITTSINDVLNQKYTDVFTGIGCFDGKYHIVMNLDVHPVQHQSRREPQPILAALRTKLEELASSIITPVTEPSNWISSLVVTKKKSGQLRICIDHNDINKGFKHAKYIKSTLEEILPKLVNAKVFSVLNAKDGFYHVKLYDESSHLTTFNTPFGRYRC